MRPAKKFPSVAFGSFLPSLFVSKLSKAPRSVGWEEVVQLIRSDELLRQSTLTARTLLAQGNKAGYSRRKEAMGAITPAVQCSSGHSQGDIVGLTMVGMIDYDTIPSDRIEEVRHLIGSDPHTFLLHTTCSGSGLRVLFRYRSDEPEVAYLDAWRAGNEYFSLLSGLPYDPAVKDACRLSFLTHDPDVLFNPASTEFLIAPPPSLHPQPSTLNPQLSSTSQLSSSNSQPSTLIPLAEEIAQRNGVTWHEGGRHRYMLYMTHLLNKMGMLETECTQWLCSIAPRGEKEARDIASYVYSRNADQHGQWVAHRSCPSPSHSPSHSPSPSPSPSPSTPPSPSAPDGVEKGGKQKNAVTGPEIRDYILSTNRLRFNVISGNIEVWSQAQQTFVDLSDRVQNSLWLVCQEAFGSRRVRQQDVHDVIHSEAVPPYNPFQDYLQSLPPYDPASMPDYIDQLAQTVHLKDDSLFRRCFKKWFVGILPPILFGGVTNQTVLIFLGRQGIYKSSFFFRLLPPELRRYYMTKTNQAHMSKDDKLAMCEYALIGLEELDSLNDRDLNQIKALITTPVVSERAAYARVKENRPHIASFCGTGNNTHFLTDLTGNRRWLPFEVDSIDSPYEHPFNYTGLYSQAFWLVQNNFAYWFSHEETSELEEHLAHFMAPNLEQDQILRYYRKPRPIGEPPRQIMEVGHVVSIAQIMERCNTGLKVTLSAKAISQAMASLGFEKRRTSKFNGFIVVEKDVEERCLEEREAASRKC